MIYHEGDNEGVDNYDNDNDTCTHTWPPTSLSSLLHQAEQTTLKGRGPVTNKTTFTYFDNIM